MLTQADIDVREWLSRNPTEAEPGAYPKIYYNVNLPPVLIHNEDQEDKIGGAWRPLNAAPVPDVPPVSLNPESATHSAAGESGLISVTITGPGVSGAWTVEKQAEATWLTVVSPIEPMMTDGAVSYVVEENTDVARVGYMYINGKTFTVNQEGVEGA